MSTEMQKAPSGIKKLVAGYHSMKAKALKEREKTQTMTGELVSTAVAAGTGAAIGFAEQKLGSRPVANLDAPVMALIASGGAALLDLGGKYNEHLYDVAKASAAIATYKVVKRNVEASTRADEKNAGKGALAGDEVDDLRNEA